MTYGLGEENCMLFPDGTAKLPSLFISDIVLFPYNYLVYKISNNFP